MRLHDIAFYAASFFLVGIFLKSSGASFIFIALLTFFVAVLFLFVGSFLSGGRFMWLAGLLMVVLIGSLYAVFFAAWQRYETRIVFEKPVEFSGVVIRYPEHGKSQALVVELDRPHSGIVLVRLQPYPEFSYGDRVAMVGVIKKPESERHSAFLAKDGIVGLSSFPRVERIEAGRGNPSWRFLFAVKTNVIGTFQKILPSEEAAFLSGVTLGERAEFSEELEERMKNSGTTHLVALSGYNISIIGWAIRKSLGNVFSRRLSFIATLFLILGFVLMTGAEASVVRAALMGAILLLAGEIGRPYSARNAIVLTACAMALANPLIVRFDVGFELSFFALIGLIYVAPVMKKILRLGEKPGFLSWRDNLAITIGAQLAVLPILIFYFNATSVVSIVSNLLVLEVIPPIMGIGFLAGAIGFFALPVSFIAGWLLYPLIAFVLGVIKLFGSLPSLVVEPGGGIAVFVFYYAVLFGGAAWFYKRAKEKNFNAALAAAHE
ncbi:ComEC/Rec2 family competence protein [Candidatus Wolfebacteria bacterium]|nr:ComEC/Rec2 family competence protein [Candidatus Wolfebacteria bacterium]